MNPLQSLPEYEQFIYQISQSHQSIQSSTLVIIPRGAGVISVRGEIGFAHGIRLIVRERVAFEVPQGEIIDYGYEVWQGARQLYWYDSQPHPHIPALRSTDPHHKHIPPDIKHNRIPAPGLSFTAPNLPFLIAEIEQTLLNKSAPGAT